MHKYDDTFFTYIQDGSLQSAAEAVPIVVNSLNPKSVVDVGCGAGAWCSQWMSSGVESVLGIDGDYVDEDRLLIPGDSFLSHDLSEEFSLDRQLDLAVSLEVAEHIPEEKAGTFIRNLTRLSDMVLFSAAVPGQGGEFHVNEQPLEYWRDKFAHLGFCAFDFLRPLLRGNRNVMPWYRYNSILYVKAEAVSSLPEQVRQCLVPEGVPLSSYSSLAWNIRTMCLRLLPERWVNQLSIAYHNIHNLGRKG